MKTIASAPSWLQDLIRAHFPQREWDNAARISYAESGWSPNAWANTDIEDSRGLFQINIRAHPNVAGQNMFDPALNVQYAALLQAAQGWNPWSTKAVVSYPEEEEMTDLEKARIALDIIWRHLDNLGDIAARLQRLEHTEDGEDVYRIRDDIRSHIPTIKQALGLQ